MGWAKWAGLLVCALLVTLHAQATTRLLKLSLTQADDLPAIVASMDFDLPQTATQALQKGVNLYFKARVQVIRPRWFWRDSVEVDQQLFWRLTYLQLSRRWRLQMAKEPWDRQGGLLSDQQFDDMPSALKAMQQIQGWKLENANFLTLREPQTLSFTFELDQYLLPRPLLLSTLDKEGWFLKITGELQLIPSGSQR